MSDLSFGTFVEFVEAVDRANRLGTELSSIETKVRDLRAEATELSAKNDAAAKAVDEAKAAAKKYLDDAEATRLEGEKQAKARADKMVADANERIKEAQAASAGKLTSLGVDIAAREQRLDDVNREIGTAEAKLAAVKAAQEAFRKAAM